LKAQESVHEPETDEAVEAEFVELNAEEVVTAKKLASKEGFEAVGSGIYKRAHKLWTMHKGTDGKYALIRIQAEPDVFPEDETREAPGMFDTEKKDASLNPVVPQFAETLVATAGKMTDSIDRFGVTIKVGDIVTYPLGGEDAFGKVIASKSNLLDIQLQGQVDKGVPSDFVIVDRRARKTAQSVEQVNDTLTKDNHAIDMVKPRPSKDDKMGAKYAELCWSTFGAELADSIVRNPLPARTIEGLKLLASMNLSTEKVSKTASWDSLKEYATEPKTSEARNLIVAGLAMRQASHELNIPFTMAWECRDVIGKLPKKAAKNLFDGLKEAEALSPKDPVVALLIRETGFENVKKACDVLQAYKEDLYAKVIKRAVDSSAKTYWEEYYGDYGTQWVRDIKRRVRADLIKATLRKQGLDDAATKYWEEYYGDYGKALVDKVDRAVTKTKDVTPEGRKASRENPPMPLPQPVKRHNIFAGITPILEENLGNIRVALVEVKKGGAHAVLIKNGEAQKKVTLPTKVQAIQEYQKAVFAFCGR